MSALNQSPRQIELTITGGISTDALEAALAKIKEVEQSYFVNPSGTPDITGATFILTGKTPYKVYSVTFTSVLATGQYTIELTGEAPNVEGL